MKTISKKLRIAEKDNNLWHHGAIKGNINESIFKVTDETNRKLENNNMNKVGQLFLTHSNLTRHKQNKRYAINRGNKKEIPSGTVIKEQAFN